MSTYTREEYRNKVRQIVEKVRKIDLNKCQTFEAEPQKESAATEVRALKPPLVLPVRQAFFQTPCTLAKRLTFKMLSFRPMSVRDMEAFCCELQRVASRVSLTFIVQPPVAVGEFQEITPAVISSMITHVRRTSPKLDLLLVAIPTNCRSLKPSLIYSCVKRCCEQQRNIISQCFKADNISEVARGYMISILMKINTKLGGQNTMLGDTEFSAIGIQPERTMIVGIDIVPCENGPASVVAAVGTCDPTFTRHVSFVQVMPISKHGVIENIALLIDNMLQEYKQINKQFPSTMVILRNRWSEKQGSMPNTEVNIAKLVLQARSSTTKLLWIGVQRQHGVGFLQSQSDITANDNKAPTYYNALTNANEPGGIVFGQDGGKYVNFHLISRLSPKNKPTGYVVVLDALNLPVDHIQRLCFLLCFTYVHTKTVLPYPVLIRYAHLCAYRSRAYLESHLALDVDKDQQSHEQLVYELNDIAQSDLYFRQKLYYV